MVENLIEIYQHKPQEPIFHQTLSYSVNCGIYYNLNMTTHDETTCVVPRKLIVVLERANLDIVKLDAQYNKRTSYELLNCDQHMNMIRRFKKDPAFCRPDIIFQCLQILQQCPLNRAGHLQVYVRTQNNELFRVDPQFAVSDSFEQFSECIVQLLHNLRPVRAKKCSRILLKLMKNPVTLHLPVGCRKFGFSHKAKKIIHPKELVPKLDGADQTVVVVVGAMAHDSCNPDYVEDIVSISKYPLSAAMVCAKLTTAFEDAWQIGGQAQYKELI